MIMNMFRHGDLLIRQIEAIPKSSTKLDTNILAEGEATGHHHRLVGGQLQIMQDTQDVGVKYFEAKSDLSLVHEEHSKLDIPAGMYSVTIEREHDIIDEATRRVYD